MRRRIEIPGQTNPTNPAPGAAGAAAVQEPPVSQQPQPNPAPQPQVPATQDLVDMSVVESLFGYAPPAVPLPAPNFVKMPRLSFKSDKGPSAAAIQQALGNVPFATPFIQMPDDSYVNASGCSLMQIAEFPYWALRRWNGEYVEIVKAWTTNPGKVEGVRIDECVLAIHVVLPGQTALAAPLQPATVVVGTWDNAKAKAASLLQREIEKATKPEWLAVNPQLAGAPPRRRVIGHLQTNSKPSRSTGLPYVIATTYCTPIGLPQMQAFAAWAASKTGPAALKQASEAFEEEKAEVIAIANKTAQPA